MESEEDSVMEKKILITGSTGNIGGQLVLEILENYPNSRLELLIRGKSEAECYGRLAANLQRLNPDFDSAAVSDQIKVFCGDMTQNNLGLRQSQYDSLMRSVTHVIHAAASTKFHLPLNQARFINCCGTENVLRLVKHAYQCGKLMNFAYISTAYVCGDREGYIRDRLNQHVEAFSNPYEQSKYEAEQLVCAYLEDHPFTIFRPSIVVGNSRTGRIISFNALYTPLKCICRGVLKTLPCEPDTPLDTVPLDYVGKAVTEMFLGSDARKRAIYHITAGEQSAPTVREIVSLTIDHFGKLAFNCPELTVEYRPRLFGDSCSHSSCENPGRAAKVLGAYAPYICRQRIFSSRKTDGILRQLGIKPPVFSEYFPVVIRYWLKSEMALLRGRAA
jgi:long-chain acyl-CoA synthetase